MLVYGVPKVPKRGIGCLSITMMMMMMSTDAMKETIKLNKFEWKILYVFSMIAFLFGKVEFSISFHFIGCGFVD